MRIYERERERLCSYVSFRAPVFLRVRVFSLWRELQLLFCEHWLRSCFTVSTLIVDLTCFFPLLPSPFPPPPRPSPWSQNGCIKTVLQTVVLFSLVLKFSRAPSWLLFSSLWAGPGVPSSLNQSCLNQTRLSSHKATKPICPSSPWLSVPLNRVRVHHVRSRCR